MSPVKYALPLFSCLERLKQKITILLCARRHSVEVPVPCVLGRMIPRARHPYRSIMIHMNRVCKLLVLCGGKHG